MSFSDNFGGKVTGSQSPGVTRDHQEEPHGHLVETGDTRPDKLGQITRDILPQARRLGGKEGRRKRAGRTEPV